VTIPAQIPGAHDTCVQLTLRNTGNTVWTQAANYALAVTNDSCNLITPDVLMLDPSASVQPGQEYTFRTTLNAPPPPMTCMLTFQMDQGGTRFGAVYNTSVQVIGALDDARALSNTVPARMAPSQIVQVGVTFQNIGSTTWCDTSTFALKIINDTCSMVGATQIPLAPGQIIPPGYLYQFVFPITAPATEGHCTLAFQMSNAGVGFGETMTAEVDVMIPPNAAQEWSIYE